MLRRGRCRQWSCSAFWGRERRFAPPRAGWPQAMPSGSDRSATFQKSLGVHIIRVRKIWFHPPAPKRAQNEEELYKSVENPHDWEIVRGGGNPQNWEIFRGGVKSSKLRDFPAWRGTQFYGQNDFMDIWCQLLITEWIRAAESIQERPNTKHDLQGSPKGGFCQGGKSQELGWCAHRLQ